MSLFELAPEVFERRELGLSTEFPQIVCLCGSTRFFDAFQKANYDLTMKGYIVLSVGFCPCQDGDPCHYEDQTASPAMTTAVTSCPHGIYHHGCPSCDRQDPEERL